MHDAQPFSRYFQVLNYCGNMHYSLWCAYKMRLMLSRTINWSDMFDRRVNPVHLLCSYCVSRVLEAESARTAIRVGFDRL